MMRIAFNRWALVVGALVAAASPLRAQSPRPPSQSRAVPDSAVLLRPPGPTPLPAAAQRGALQPAPVAVVMPVAAPTRVSAPPPPPSAPVSQTVAPIEIPQAAPPPATTVVTPAAARSMARVRDEEPPPGATARCRDGSYLTGGAADVGCADKGGLAAVLPAARNASPPKAKQ